MTTASAPGRDFERALERLADGYAEGRFAGQSWGVTTRRSPDGRRVWLFAEHLGGTDIVSFNLYRPGEEKALLKPCEMSSDKVVDFVLRFQPNAVQT